MNIVIVEDEAPIREGLEKIITKLDSNYQVVGVAADGHAGLQLIMNKKPDLIIMDIRMPEMDGLAMLEHVRSHGIDSKAVVLSAFSDFTYAQQAIHLGIERYLLKPIRVQELTDMLEHVKRKISMEHKLMFSMDTFLIQGLTGQLEINDELKKELVLRYNLYLNRPAYVFVSYLGEDYEQYQDQIKEKMQELRFSAKHVPYCHTIKVSGSKMILSLIYGIEEPEILRQKIETYVVKILLEITPNQIFVWKQVPNLEKMHVIMKQLEAKLDWNLILGSGVLLTSDKIEEIKTKPMLYPYDIENKAKQALIHRQMVSFRECIAAFCSRCRKERYSPKDIKEIAIRFCMAILSMAKQYGYKVELSNQTVIQSIMEAMNWKQISDEMNGLFKNILSCPQEVEMAKSPLIQRAMEVIRKEYRNGLTLEELAGKLYVSDEYLSTQFKKTTGKTFTETIRKIRMERVKELLLESNLKLNQISCMVGITDPKYMSKLFKEEYGVLPAEYRKMHAGK